MAQQAGVTTNHPNFKQLVTQSKSCFLRLTKKSWFFTRLSTCSATCFAPAVPMLLCPQQRLYKATFRVTTYRYLVAGPILDLLGYERQNWRKQKKHMPMMQKDVQQINQRLSNWKEKRQKSSKCQETSSILYFINQ